MASLQTALTARKNKSNTTVHTTRGSFTGTITDDGSVGDSIILERETDNGLGPIGAGEPIQLTKAQIVGIFPIA